MATAIDVDPRVRPPGHRDGYHLPVDPTYGIESLTELESLAEAAT